MRVGILGSGAVGVAMAKGFIAEGHHVWLATREPDGEKGALLKREVEGATVCDFAAAAKEAEVAVLCVKWAGAREAIDRSGADNLAGKVIIDTSNLIKSQDGTLLYDGGEMSGAEEVQTWLPECKVVKAFNTTGAATIYKPDFGGSKPTMFLAGDDQDAKRQVQDIVTMFGWEPLDAGKLVAARLLEPMALVWINYRIATDDRHHAFKIL